MNNFIEKTLRDIQKIFTELFQSEITAAKKGLLQALDPRVKLLSLLSLVLFANLVQSLTQLGILIGYLFILAVFSRVPVYPLGKRVAIIAILFTGLLAFPSIFNLIRPGDLLWRVTDHIYVTKQGVQGAAFLILRSFTSLTAIFLLTVTTKWVNLLKALRVLKVPAIFVTTLEMAERYLFLCLEVAGQTFTARKSRTLAKVSSREDRRFIAAATGNLLIRTSVLSDAVYQAMLSRGYCGEVKTLERFRTRLIDWLWLGWNLVLIVGLFQSKI